MKKFSFIVFFVLILVIPMILGQLVPPSPGDFGSQEYELSPEELEKLQRIMQFVFVGFIFFIIISIIDLILRGFAMWKASKRDQKVWFWCLLIFHTLMILPIIYLLIYRGSGKKKKKKK